MAELLPCPFCGRQAELRYTKEGFAYIVCANDGCYARTDGHLNEESAIKHWNKRTVDVVEIEYGEWIEEQGKSYLVSPMKYDTNGEPILQNYVIYKCSCCGRVEDKLEPYCHCGAKMDGGRAE